MSEKITREVYMNYAKRIVSVLSGESFYSQFKSRVDSGASTFKLAKKRLVQDISIDWIETIEDCLPNLDTIVRNPRKFIVQEEDIVDISLARSISTESVKHLAQHTNMISKVDDDGMVTPNKILNITKEESFEIYENRFIYTLLLKLKDFVTMRYDKIKKASATQDVLELDVESRFGLPSKKITYRTEYLAQLSFDEVMQLDPDTLTKIERVAKIDRIITDFLSSSFAKSMRNSAPVRPPITRTNVILKEPNFKKALTLWQFVETYQQTGGFATSDDIEPYDISDTSIEQLKDMVTLNTMLFESLYDQQETDFDMDDAEFADVLRVGEMDFQKDEIDRDKYAQELDQKELDREEQNKEEVSAKEVEEATVEEEKPSEEKSEEEPEPPEEPEIEETEVEKPVDQELEVEAPPKDEPEDTEPDADRFDQQLFDVRKLYKRPECDKIRQEDAIRVRDAIDRCLMFYRRIKQEELDEREREENRRLRRLEIEKRAEEFRRQRDALELEYKKERDSAYFGKDPFHSQAVKLVLPTAEADFKDEHKELFKKKELFKTNERLTLEDKNAEAINKSIAMMEEQAAIKKKAEEETLRRDAEFMDAISEPKAESGIKEVEAGADNKLKERKPRAKKDAARQIDTAENKNKALTQNSAVMPENGAKKPNIRLATDREIDPWGLSATTLNQKYSKPSGKVKNLTAVDENKVAVGDIRIGKEEEIDPYAELEKLKKSAKKQNKKASDDE